jgi:urate oxidase
MTDTATTDTATTDTASTDTAAKVKVVLGQNNYGKADVRLFKVFRDTARHEVKDVWVNVAMEGDFTAAHVSGDNTDLLATDTVRNTVYALAEEGLTGSIEEYGKVLIRHLVKAGPKVSRVRVSFTEHLWQRAETAGVQHDHAFSRLMPKHTAWVEGDGQSFTVMSGIDELFILKTTQSGWEGFLREQFTSLPDTDDRILATVVTAKWEYLPAEGGRETEYGAVWQRVYDQLIATFGDHYSPSMQHTLYRMGEAILTVCPEIARIHFSFPNRHHIRYNLERFGAENPNTVFHADAEPYGLIEGWVERVPETGA